MHNSVLVCSFLGLGGGVQDEASGFCPVSGLFEGEGVQDGGEGCIRGPGQPVHPVSGLFEGEGVQEGEGVRGLLKGFLGALQGKRCANLERETQIVRRLVFGGAYLSLGRGGGGCLFFGLRSLGGWRESR